jgi:hypothetical protein
MELNAQPMTPAHIAVAIVAACGVTGTKPDKVFEEGNGRARVMAAAGCISRLGWDKLTTARAFRVHPNRLTPSGLTLARVYTEQLLVIAEALQAQGLVGGPAEAPPASPPPAAAAATPQRKAVPAAKAETRAPDPKPAASAKPQAPVRAQRANPVRPTPPPARVQRLTTVKPSVVRWARQQLALGAAMDFLAWCFDVDVDDLAAAVRPEQAVAA